MDQGRDILSAETLAAQAVLVHVLRHLAKSDLALRKAIAAGIDDAASEIGNTAIQPDAAEHKLEALRSIETTRKAVFS
jgi:hypothetical protein